MSGGVKWRTSSAWRAVQGCSCDSDVLNLAAVQGVSAAGVATRVHPAEVPMQLIIDACAPRLGSDCRALACRDADLEGGMQHPGISGPLSLRGAVAAGEPGASQARA